MTDGEIVRQRILLALVGAAGGFSIYVLTEWLDQSLFHERTLFAALCLTLTFFGGFLGTIGPLRPMRAAGVSLAVAVLATGLALLASLRYQTVDRFLDGGLHMVAVFVLITVPFPFLIAWGRGTSLRHYPTLFSEAWGIVVRYLAAWVFVGIFWLVVVLSDQLLKIVGIEVISDLLDFEPVPWLLTGLALGLAIAVVNELSEVLSPSLLLRLLRLFLPLVLVIVAVFIAALPFRGLSGLFGGFSAAGILMAMTLGIATLITTAVDMTDGEAVKSRIMVVSAQILALLLPVLGGLAVYAIWVRVAEYGWTPERLAAGTAALVLLGYGILYAGAVILRRDWKERVRQANIIKAGVLVVVAALWLTPVFNAERMSSASQVARYQGGATPEQMDTWVMAHGWGKAGKRGLDRLSALAQGDADMLERIAEGQAATNRWEFGQRTAERNSEGQIAALSEVMPLRPGTGLIPRDMLKGARPHELQQLTKGCALTTPGGNVGCVAVTGDFLPGQEGTEMFLLALRKGGAVAVFGLRQVDGERRHNGHLLEDPEGGPLKDTHLDALIDGRFEERPAVLNALDLGDAALIMRP